MIDNSLMKSNLKQFEFVSHTPLRGTHTLNNGGEFSTSQKLKYDTAHRQLNQSLNNAVNPMGSNESYSNQKDIYENQLKVRIKTQDREDYQNILTIKITFLNPPSHGQILHIDLTDESNHLFLYTLDLSETDFFHLKNEQSILVDFQAFPARLIEMFDLCLNSSGTNERLNFLCVLNIRNTGEAHFNIVETNQFKALTHLSLRFREANDQILKQYLAGRLTTERASNEELRGKVDRLEDHVNIRTSELEKVHNDYKRLQLEKDQKIEEIKNTEAKKLNEFQRLALENETSLKNEYEREKKEIIARYEKRSKEQEDKIQNLTASNVDLLNSKIELESKQRELTGTVRAFEKENTSLQTAIEKIRVENTELSNARFNNEKKIAQLEATIKSLETQILNKDEIIRKTNELLESTNEQKGTHEESIGNYKKQIEKLESKINACSEEINKGNEIIEKLQGDLAVQKQKMKTKNNLVLDQEKTIDEQKDKIEHLTKTINEIQRENEQKQFRIKELETTIEDLKNKLQESQKAIETSNSMIQWLNKSLNETQKPVGPRATTFSTTKYAPVSPNRQFEENPATRTSYKASVPFDVDRYSKYNTGEFNGGLTGGAPSFGARTMGIPPTQSYLDKSGAKGFGDYDRELTGNLNKENYDLTNKGMNYRAIRTSGIERDLYSTTPNKDLDNDLSNYVPQSRTIQPIRYQDPKK